MVRILLNGEDAQFNAEDIDGLRVTIRANDVTDFGKTKGDYAINLKLPFSDNNRLLINNVLDIQNKTGYLQTANIICDIIVNSLTIIKGKFYIEKWDNDFFYGYVISNNIDWTNELANKSIRQVESFREFRYSGVALWDLQAAGTETLPDGTPYTPGNTVQIFDVWQDDGTLYDVQFPLVAYGNFPVPPASTFDNAYANADGLFLYNYNVPPSNFVTSRTPGNTNFATLSWQQFYPAVYLRSLVKAIFQDVNLTVKGSYLTDPRFDNLLIPYTPEDDSEPEWNIGLMGRLDIEYKRILNTDPMVTITFSSSIGVFPTSNLQEAIYTDYIVYYRFILNDLIPQLGPNHFPDYGSIEYYTYDKANVGSNTQTVETIYWDRNGFDYVYGNSQATFVNSILSPMQGVVIDYNQELYSYKVKKDGKYYIQVTFTDINEVTGNFYHLFVTNKKGVSFLGNEGNYLIDKSTLGSAQVYDSSVLLASRQSGVQPLVTLSGTFNLLKGDIIELVMAIEESIPSISLSIEFSSIRFKVYPQFDVALNIANLLPDINCIDFISSLQQTFNLFITTNLTDRTVSIDSYKENFLPVSSAINIDKKCNIRDAVFTPVTNNARIDTIITPDENDILSAEKRLADKSTVQQDNNTTQNYYDSFYRNNNNYFTETKEIDSFFSDTITGLFKWIYNNGTPDDSTAGFLELPLLADADALSYTLQELSDGTATNKMSYNLRLLKYMGLRTLKNTSGVYALMVDNHGYYDLAGNNSSLMNTAAYNSISASNTSPIIPIAVYEPYLLTTYDIPSTELIANSNVLTYADKYIYSYSGIVTRLKGLYNEYFIQFINDTNNSIQVDIPVWIDANDIQEIDPKKYIIFYNQLFFLKELKDYDPVNRKLTQMTLIRK